MADNRKQGVGKLVAKGLGIGAVGLVALSAFLYVEVAMSGSDLNDPSQMRIWLLMVGGIIVVAGGLIILIARA